MSNSRTMLPGRYYTQKCALLAEIERLERVKCPTAQDYSAAERMIAEARRLGMSYDATVRIEAWFNAAHRVNAGRIVTRDKGSAESRLASIFA